MLNMQITFDSVKGVGTTFTILVDSLAQSDMIKEKFQTRLSSIRYSYDG